MPTIADLVPAEAAHAAALIQHEHLRGEIERLEMLLRVHKYNYDTQLEEARANLEAARTKQNNSLTAWTSPHKGQFNRDILKQKGATNRTWDNRAWLRQMYVEHEKAWLWTLDAHVPGKPERRRVFLRDLIDVEGAFEHELKNAADAFLESLGWNLTNLQNDTE